MTKTVEETDQKMKGELTDNALTIKMKMADRQQEIRKAITRI